MKSTKSIVEQYVKAVEDKKAKDRYIAPCYQGAFIQFQRIIGKQVQAHIKHSDNYSLN